MIPAVAAAVDRLEGETTMTDRSTTRRTFLRDAAAVGAAGMALPLTRTVTAGARSRSPIKHVVVSCQHRGALQTSAHAHRAPRVTVLELQVRRL
jgi:hypothetical protein